MDLNGYEQCQIDSRTSHKKENGSLSAMLT